MKKIFDTFTMLIVVLGPLFLKPEFFFDWHIWVVTSAIIFLVLSQPKADLKIQTNTKDNSSILIILAVLVCLIVPVLDYAFNSKSKTTFFEFSTYVGALILFIGFAFRYWSIKILGDFFTTRVEIKTKHELIRIGPYKFMRHPSYTGAWLGILGVSIFLNSFLGIMFCVLVFLPVYAYRISIEEQALIKRFPKEYSEYQKKTWKMFPYLY